MDWFDPDEEVNMIGDTADLLRKRVESLQTATKEGVEIAPPLSVDEGTRSFVLNTM